jgi:hypothetical protein
MKVRIKKNKLAPALKREAEFDFTCGRGTEPYSDIIEYAKSIGMLRFAGSSVKVALPNEEEHTMCTGGKAGAREHLIGNPGIFEQLKRACYSASGITNTSEGDSESSQSCDNIAGDTRDTEPSAESGGDTELTEGT